MTTARKAVLIIATILVVGGMGLSFVAFAVTGFNLSSLSTTARDWVPTTHTFAAESEEAHTSLTVRDFYENVRFEPSSTDAVEVTYWESESSNKLFTVTDENGAITVDGPSLNSLVGSNWFVMMDFADRSTVVKVPRDWTGAITTETASGNISVTDLASIEALSAQTGSGNVFATGITAQGAVKLNTTSGFVEAHTIQAANLTVEVMSGNVLLDAIASDTVQAKCTSGNIEASALAANTVTLECMSGNVATSLMGASDDYTIEATAASGTIEAPRGAINANKHLIVHTISGNIEVAFSHSSASAAPSDLEDSDGAASAAPAAPAAPTAL